MNWRTYIPVAIEFLHQQNSHVISYTYTKATQFFLFKHCCINATFKHTCMGGRFCPSIVLLSYGCVQHIYHSSSFFFLYSLFFLSWLNISIYTFFLITMIFNVFLCHFKIWYINEYFCNYHKFWFLGGIPRYLYKLLSTA